MRSVRPSTVPSSQPGSRSAVSSSSTEYNPYAVTSQVQLSQRTYELNEDPLPDRARFGRLSYLGYHVAAMLALFFLVTMRVAPLGLLLFVFLMVRCVYMRVRDVGFSEWMIFLFLVPFANFYIGYMCAAAPRGYAITKKSDTAMTVISVVLVLFLIFFVIVGVTNA